MCMRLKKNCTRAYHFSPLASLVVWRTNLIEALMRSRQSFCLRQCSLPGRFSGPVYVDDHLLHACSVTQRTRGRKWVALQHNFLKAYAQGLHCGLVKSTKKSGQG